MIFFRPRSVLRSYKYITEGIEWDIVEKQTSREEMKWRWNVEIFVTNDRAGGYRTLRRKYSCFNISVINEVPVSSLGR